MAIGWLSLLKTVPWAQVISTAPLVADGARKLWNGVAKKTAAAPSAASVEPDSPVAQGSEAETLTRVRTQLVAVEARVADLHEQMLASSALIKALADQNAELIKRVETNRIRLLWLTVIIVAVLAVIGLSRVFT
ncbi:MAG: hypothetical protein CVU28_04175 [Betaproteobacteria bacterium HGW-Betaproteobacteria-21]|nr:MAG: hypothetical protein CVU28_04175 [Betaproteobacteria bacterium HGW-Betaproteobacteria-21]